MVDWLVCWFVDCKRSPQRTRGGRVEGGGGKGPEGGGRGSHSIRRPGTGAM